MTVEQSFSELSIACDDSGSRIVHKAYQSVELLLVEAHAVADEEGIHSGSVALIVDRLDKISKSLGARHGVIELLTRVDDPAVAYGGIAGDGIVVYRRYVALEVRDEADDPVRRSAVGADGGGHIGGIGDESGRLSVVAGRPYPVVLRIRGHVICAG